MVILKQKSVMKQRSKPHSPPKHTQAIQTSRHLHVAHHRHTGHVLPKRSTSWAALVMIMLCVGVLLLSWTRVVTADSANYVVHASVPGPPPSVSATIDTPLDGAAFTTSPITVTGTCPLSTYVEILKNNFSSGIALCSASGTYTVDIALFEGVNQLVARDFSFTDQAGPDSAITTVTYSIPGSPILPSGGTTQPPYTPGVTQGIAVPLLLRANYTFVGYYVGQPATWKIKIEGGNPPYAIHVDWGDGKTQLFSVKDLSTVTLQHVYAKPGAYHGSYPVKINASDSAGHQTYLQLLAIISNRTKTVVTTGSTTPSGINFGDWSNIGHALTAVWSTYGLVLLMLISFWLGERRELFVMRHKQRRGHRA